MKKMTRQKAAAKKIFRHQPKASHHHLRIIPWTMAALAVFYLVSLAAIIRIYPEVFSVPSSLAENMTTLPTGTINTSNVNPLTGTSVSAPSTTVEKSTLSSPTSTTATSTDATVNMDKTTSTTDILTTSPNTQTTNTTGISTTNPSTQTSTNNISTTPTSATDANKITNISPGLKFLSPADKATVSGKKIFSASVENAQGVEFYLIKSGSLTDQFLCSAKNSDGNNWKCEVQTSNIPNGEYKLLAKIKNAYGTYKSSAITIKIANEIASTSTSSTSNLGDTATSGSETTNQTAKVSAQEVQKVQETVETRSQEQNIQNNIAGNVTAANATVAGALPQTLDNDQDGVSNEEEKRIGTDPNSADTDKDGYMDGDEIKNGFNPLKSSNGGDKIVFESPKEKGETKKELIWIESVEMVAKPAESTENNSAGAEKEIQLQGKGLPNSFVTIYIYSETPTIVTVMTDENGNWTYTLDKNIENGQHEAYVAITDNEGHITAKSEPFFFAKTAQAATKSSAEEIARNAASVQSPVAASRSKQVAVIGFVIIISLFTVIACIGLYLVYHYHHKREPAIRKDYLVEK